MRSPSRLIYLITINCMLVCVAGRAMGQNFVFFPTEAKWKVECSYGTQSGGVAVEVHQYYFTGDTIIDSLGRIWKKFDAIMGGACPGPYSSYMGDWDFYDQYVPAYLYEDSLQGLVYYSQNPPSSYLLCNYNLGPGDTLENYFTGPNHTQNGWVVQTIDTISLYGKIRRKWNFYSYGGLPFQNGYMLEGLGYSSGFIEPLGWIYFYSGLTWISCVYSDSEGLLLRDSTLCSASAPDQTCDTLTYYPVNREKITEKKLSVFPNPGYSSLTIQSERNLITAFSLFDARGKFILESEPQSYKLILNTEQLQNGIYLYHCRLENDIWTSGIWVKKE